MQKTGVQTAAMLAVLVATMFVAGAQAEGRGGAGQGQAQPQQRSPVQTREQRTTVEKTTQQQKTQEQKKIRKSLRDREIYGREMMTAEERKAYRKRIEAATTDKEWAQIREEHHNEMRARAQAQGRELDPPLYGQHMITARERREYTKRMQSAQTDAEREQVRAAHREMIRERAAELGLQPPA